MIIFTLPLPGRWNSQDSSSKYIGKWPVAQDPLSASRKKLLFIMFSHGPTWSHYVSPDLALDTSVWSRSRHTKRTCREYCRSLTHQLNSTKSLSIFGTSWTSWRVARYQFHCSLFLGGPPKDRTVFPGYRRLHKFPRFPTFRPVKLGCTSWLQVLSGGSMSFPGMCCRIEEVEVMVWPVFFFRRGSMLWCYMTLPYNYNCIMCVYIYICIRFLKWWIFKSPRVSILKWLNFGWFGSIYIYIAWPVVKVSTFWYTNFKSHTQGGSLVQELQKLLPSSMKAAVKLVKNPMWGISTFGGHSVLSFQS